MENYSYSSYPDSGNSSPRSREIDCENPAWDEVSNYKVKFMCSYGGKIHPRPNDNQLSYVGGDTKILAFDRSVKFAPIMAKLSSLCEADVCFKYQLPGEDLDALISVTNDEDLEHMMLEYDRLHRASVKPARLRLFLFPTNPPDQTGFSSSDGKSERQWFVDALNSVQIQPMDLPTPPAAVSPAMNPDFLFGLDKGVAPDLPKKVHDPTPVAAPAPVPDVNPKEILTGTETRQAIGDPVVYPTEMQRQMHELQRLQISNQEQALLHRKSEESTARAYPADYYTQKLPEKASQPQIPATVPFPAQYWQERHITTGGYPASTATTTDQHVYFIPAPASAYQSPTLRPVTNQVNQAGYYGMQRIVPEVYREQPVYNQVTAAKLGAYTDGIGMSRPVAAGVGVTEQGYTQVTYDGTGRQVFYTTQGGMMPQYQTVTMSAPVPATTVDGRQVNQESKAVPN